MPSSGVDLSGRLHVWLVCSCARDVRPGFVLVYQAAYTSVKLCCTANTSVSWMSL